MQQNIKLSEHPALHIYLSHIVQILLYTKEIIDLEFIEAQLTNIYLKQIHIEDNLLSITMKYNIHKSDMLNLINISNLTTNKFHILSMIQNTTNNEVILSLDIIYKDSNSLIHDLLVVKDFSYDNIIAKYFYTSIIEALTEDCVTNTFFIHYKNLEESKRHIIIKKTISSSNKF